MKTEEFLITFLKRGGAYIAGASEIERNVNSYIHWDLKYFLAKATATINYGCNFNALGLCNNRDPSLRNKTKKELDEMVSDNRNHPSMCCCNGCFMSVGYLNELPNHLDIITAIAKLFDGDNATGFWRKGKGCILPRKYRSSTCLGHHCYPLEREERFLLLLLNRNVTREVVYDLRNKVYLLLRDKLFTNAPAGKIREVVDTIYANHVKGDKKFMKELGLGKKRER